MIFTCHCLKRVLKKRMGISSYKYTLIYFKNALISATLRFYKEKYIALASALAFTTLLALVPFLSITVFCITLYPFFSNLTNLTEHYVLQNFIPSTALSIESYLHAFLQQTSHLPMLSFLFLFVTALLLINTIEETLNEIWHSHKKRKKIWALIFYGLTLLLLPVIMGLSIFLSTYLFSLPWITATTSILELNTLTMRLLPILINTILFSLFYILVPNVSVKWRQGFLGGFVAASLFELSRIGFTFYITHFPSYELIYGAFAIIPIFLLWLYIVWFIILWGALLTYALSSQPAVSRKISLDLV